MSTQNRSLPDQLAELVTRLTGHQRAARLTDNQWARRHSRYFSQKTWTDRLLKADYGDLSIPKQIAKLNELLATLEGGQNITEVYDIPLTREVMDTYEELQGQTSDRRNAIVSGVTGVGKTWSARHLARVYSREAVYLQIEPTWTNRQSCLVNALAAVLGTEVSTMPSTTFDGVLKHLQAHPITLLIDDAHEGGVTLLKLVKIIIDKSRAKTILFAYPTELKRLMFSSATAYEEARQLLGRTIKPLVDGWGSGVTQKDVTAYLRAATGETLDKAAASALAARITQTIAGAGNLRILADVVEAAAAVCEEAGRPVDPAAIEAVLDHFCPAKQVKS